VWIDCTTADAGGTKKKKENLGLFKYDFYGAFTPDELYNLFSFLENPTQKWDHLTTKPPDTQLSFF